MAARTELTRAGLHCFIWGNSNLALRQKQMNVSTSDVTNGLLSYNLVTLLALRATPVKVGGTLQSFNPLLHFNPLNNIHFIKNIRLNKF